MINHNKITNNVSSALQLEGEVELLQRVSIGDRNAYAQLYTHYLPKLYHYLYRFTKQSHETTEEIVQEVFLTIWEKRETLIGINSFERYLYITSKHKVLNLLKHEDYKNKLHISFCRTQDSAHSNTEKGILYDEYHKIALQAINNLPVKRKEVFLLSTQEELSLDEIAKHLGISKSRVKQQLYEGKNYIKKFLHKNSGWLALLICILKPNL